jgi:hypothetical protein
MSSARLSRPSSRGSNMRAPEPRNCGSRVTLRGKPEASPPRRDENALWRDYWSITKIMTRATLGFALCGRLMPRSAGQNRLVGWTPPAGLRATASLIAVLLLLVQLFAVGSRVDPPGGRDLEVARAGAAQNCEQPSHRGRPDSGGHPHCCLLCEWSGRADFALLTPSPADFPHPAGAKRPPAPPESDRPTRPPVGWTSSWSSRAPPAFS